MEDAGGGLVMFAEIQTREGPVLLDLDQVSVIQECDADGRRVCNVSRRDSYGPMLDVSYEDLATQLAARQLVILPSAKPTESATEQERNHTQKVVDNLNTIADKLSFWRRVQLEECPNAVVVDVETPEKLAREALRLIQINQVTACARAGRTGMPQGHPFP